jgi:hypothetical protein
MLAINGKPIAATNSQSMTRAVGVSCLARLREAAINTVAVLSRSVSTS